MRLSDIPEHEIREWCSRTGCWASWRDVQGLFREIDEIPHGRWDQFVDAEEVRFDQMNIGAVGHRVIARALKAGADTVVGKAIAEHDCARHSASLAYWLSRSIVPSQE